MNNMSKLAVAILLTIPGFIYCEKVVERKETVVVHDNRETMAEKVGQAADTVTNTTKKAARAADKIATRVKDKTVATAHKIEDKAVQVAHAVTK